MKNENPDKPVQFKCCRHCRQETEKDSANALANLGAAEEMSAQKTLLERQLIPAALRLDSTSTRF